MKQEFLKKWNIVAVGLSVLSALYFLVKFIINSIDPDKITDVYKVFDIIGFALLGIALLMFVFIILFVKHAETKELKLSQTKDQDQELLKKYKKKN